jgi:hypothetical protein
MAAHKHRVMAEGHWIIWTANQELGFTTLISTLSLTPIFDKSGNINFSWLYLLVGSNAQISHESVYSKIDWSQRDECN